VREPPIPHELVVEARIRGVSTTRIGHDEHGGASDALGLGAGSRAGRGPHELAIRRATHERHDGWLNPHDRPCQLAATARVVDGGELGCLARGAGDDVGEGQTELRQSEVVDERQLLGHEAGGVEQSVEGIAGSGGSRRIAQAPFVIAWLSVVSL
jgi:hypothetical protein